MVSQHFDLQTRFHCWQPRQRCFLIVALSAVALFAAACGLGLSEAEQRYNAGLEHHEEGRWAEAITEYDAAIESDATLAVAYAGRAGVRMEIGEVDAALADISRAIDLDPDNAKFYSNRAGTLLVLGEYDDAITDSNRAIELDATLVNVYSIRGRAHVALGNFAEALVDFNRVIELDSASILAGTANINGAWDFILVVTAENGVCSGESDVPQQRQVTIEQDGPRIKVSGFGGADDAWLGVSVGSVHIFGGIRPEDGGITTSTIVMLLDDDGDSIRGQERWSWTGPEGECPDGESAINGTRAL